jgi:ankyrin repeat protein
LEPVDLLLLMACSENDAPKVEELLRAGADTNVKDLEGKSPMELCTKDEIKELLRA